MADGSTGSNVRQARDMLAAFASVGARQFDLTVTDLDGRKVFFRRTVPFADLNHDMPGTLKAATKRQHNVIVRPRGGGVSFVQLDDLAPQSLARLAPAVFLTLRTSPGNFQAWTAIEGDEDKDFARRMRMGVGADMTASGATRVAGSLNFKPKYAPEFPRVEIAASRPCLTMTRAALDQLRFLAPRDPEPARPALPRRNMGARGWPDYGRCLSNAPSGSDPGSRADFVWCMIALDWGWSAEAVTFRLMEESGKAQENGERYASRTVESAAAAVARRGPPRIRLGAPGMR